MSDMVEVVIDSLRVSLTNQQRIVVLREIDIEQRYLPIWIGPYEAESITIALQEIEIARPQTHDLFKNLLHTLNARLVRVEVVALQDDVFYGNLVVEINGDLINIDSRPSDALALAVRTNSPIMVAQEVMKKAGIIPKRDLQDKKPAPLADKHDKTSEDIDSEERLSIFEDFLEKLDIDDSSNSSKNDNKSEEEKPDSEKE